MARQEKEFAQHQERISNGRQKMDANTVRIVLEVAQRTRTAREIHGLKRELGLPVGHAQREAEVIEHAEKLAESAGLTREDGMELAQLLMKIAMRGQE